MKKIMPLLTVGLMLSVAVSSMFVAGTVDDKAVDGEMQVTGTIDDTVVDGRMQEERNKYEGSAWWGSTRLTDYRIGTDWLALPNEGNITWGADADIEARYNSTSNVLEWTGGDQSFDSNITAENVFLPAFVFAHTNATIPVAVAGTWYNVIFNERVSSPKLRIVHTHTDDTNTTFTIIDSGYYDIHYALSFSDSQATPSNHIVMRVVRNGVEIAGSLLEEDSTKQYSDFTISNGPIIYLNAGDEIQFQFTSDATTVSLTSHRTYGDHHDTAVVKIRRVA